MSLREQLIESACRAGGSYDTVDGRVETARRFHDWLKSENRQERDIKNLNKVALVRGFVASLQTSKGDRQNAMAELRGIYRAAGMEKFADHRELTNRALGLDGRSRDGTHRVPSDGEYRKITAALAENSKFSREKALFELCRNLGLRVEEAVQSDKSLRTWARQLEAGTRLSVIYGTKGGRARDVRIPASLRGDAIKAVRDCIAHCKSHPEGRLIDAPSVQRATERVHYVASRVGMVGEISPHSLRYSFAHDAARTYLAEGLSKRETLSALSLDLGHGDGRGRYVNQVYLRGFDWPPGA